MLKLATFIRLHGHYRQIWQPRGFNPPNATLGGGGGVSFKFNMPNLISGVPQDPRTARNEKPSTCLLHACAAGRAQRGRF